MTQQWRLPFWGSLVFAVAGGVLLWCSFAPVSWGVLAIPGAALVIAACWGVSWKRGLLVGALAHVLLDSFTHDWGWPARLACSRAARTAASSAAVSWPSATRITFQP